MPDLRRGMVINFEGKFYEVIDFQHIMMGRGQAHIKTKLKNIETGQVIEKTLREADHFEEVELREREATFSYTDGENYIFYDSERYEEIVLSAEKIRNQLLYLKEGQEVKVQFINEKAVGIVLPTAVVLEVVETDPGIRGDTASGGSKPAKLETGLVVKVPLYIKEGEKIKVDTRTGEYIERA
ncbi:MAG: elongation factor P [Candidatus Hydrothermales bacterium]